LYYLLHNQLADVEDEHGAESGTATVPWHVNEKANLSRNLEAAANNQINLAGIPKYKWSLLMDSHR